MKRPRYPLQSFYPKLNQPQKRIFATIAHAN